MYKYEGLQDKIKEMFLNSNGPTILFAMLNVFRIVMHENKRTRLCIGVEHGRRDCA